MSSNKAAGTDDLKMEIAGLGLAMIVVSVVPLVWAFARLPAREPARRR